MSYRLSDLADVLRAGGLEVIEIDGWKTRGHGDIAKPKQIVCHHTADGLPSAGPYPSLGTVKNGRPGLRGPLAQLGLGRDLKWRTIAAGLCWHAGPWRWQGVTQGNMYGIGIEAENTGYIRGPTAEAWSPEMLECYAHGVAVLCDHYGIQTYNVAGHKEGAIPPGRKTDPTFDMTLFRAKVNSLRGNKVAAAPMLNKYAKTLEKMDAVLPPQERKIALAIADSREYTHPWEMIDIIVSQGFTDVQAFGWTGNAQQESYEELRPDVWGDAYQARGIFQWHGARWAALKEYAASKGGNEFDLKTQVMFSLIEPGERHAHDKLHAADTIEQAVDAGIAYLRPGRPNRPRRLALAYALQEWWPEVRAHRQQPKEVEA